MNPTIQKISEQVDSLRHEMVAFLARLVQFPSLPGKEQAAQHFYAEKLQTLGLNPGILVSRKEELESHPAFCDDGIPFDEGLNVVGRWSATGNKSGKKDAPRTLILNGHMDVVPTGREALWSASPWSGEVRSEEHTSELQSHHDLVCRLLLEKKKKKKTHEYAKRKIQYKKNN